MPRKFNIFGELPTYTQVLEASYTIYYKQGAMLFIGEQIHKLLNPVLYDTISLGGGGGVLGWKNDRRVETLFFIFISVVNGIQTHPVFECRTNGRT